MKTLFLSLILGLGLVSQVAYAQSEKDEASLQVQTEEEVKSCEDLQETDANFKQRIVECMGPSDWQTAKLESPVVNH